MFIQVGVGNSRSIFQTREREREKECGGKGGDGVQEGENHSMYNGTTQ